MSKIIIETIVLKELCSKISKSNLASKNIAISNYLSIKAQDSILVLHTTDIDNHLIVKSEIQDSSSFEATVELELFCKLISTFEKEATTIELSDNKVSVSQGNSNKYKFEIPLDEEGQPVKIKEPEMPSSAIDISYDSLQKVIKYLGSAVGTDYVTPIYTGYFISEDAALSTNRYKICMLEENLLPGIDKILLPSRLVHLLSILEDNNLKYAITEYGIYFITDSAIAIGIDMKEVMSYPKDTLINFIKEDLLYKFKVKKSELVPVINRLGLFIHSSDKSTIVLSTKQKELVISNLKESGTDSVKIDWISAPNENWTQKIDFLYFKPLVDAIEDEYIEFHIGEAPRIRMECKDCKQVLTVITD